MAKKYSLINKPVAVGDDNKKFSILSDDSKEQLKEAILRQQNKKEAKTVDISEYLPEQYVQKSVSIDILKAAPDDWNFFIKPSKEKIIALAESIYYNGLLQPIVVRELDPDGITLEILAGHTRVEAYRALRETIGGKDYDTIQALVFPFNTLSDNQAEDIVCDTNFMQRGTLSTMETARCIQLKAKRIRQQKRHRGDGSVASKISEYYHIKRASVFRWQRIANLIPELVALSEQRQLTADSMYKLSGFSPAEQERIYRRAADYISNNSLRFVRTKHKIEDVIRILKDDTIPDIALHYSVAAEDLNERIPMLLLVPKEQYEDVLKIAKNKKLILIK